METPGSHGHSIGQVNVQTAEAAYGIDHDPVMSRAENRKEESMITCKNALLIMESGQEIPLLVVNINFQREYVRFGLDVMIEIEADIHVSYNINELISRPLIFSCIFGNNPIRCNVIIYELICILDTGKDYNVFRIKLKKYPLTIMI